MLGVYLTLGNLPSYVRTVVDSQQLVLLCREADFKHFGYNLEGGIMVNGRHYIGQLAFICGDNLGSHCIGGFMENFSRASYIYRFCMTTMQDFKDDKPAELRTVSSYTEAVARAKENEAGFMGVKQDSPFNKLSMFHVCLPGLPPCLGHDLFEGVVDYDLALIIKHFVKSLNWFSYQHLNTTIESKFKYNPCHQKKNKPAPVNLKGTRLGGQAMQNCTLLLLFPIIVGDKVIIQATKCGAFA